MQKVAELFELDLELEAARWEARDTIAALLKPWFAAHTLAEIRDALNAVGACWGPYQTFREAVAEDPRLSTENPMFQEIDQPGVGRYLASGPMVDFSEAPRTPVVPAPRLGADTDAILSGELGLDSGQIGRLHDTGIVAGPDSI
jgi:2-methylfumaryl-CoA isomerase